MFRHKTVTDGGTGGRRRGQRERWDQWTEVTRGNRGSREDPERKGARFYNGEREGANEFFVMENRVTEIALYASSSQM